VLHERNPSLARVMQLGCPVLREREPSFARVYAVRVPLRGCAAATSNCRCVVRTDKTKSRVYNVHSDVVAWWLRLNRQAADQKERSLLKMKSPIAHWPSLTQKSTCPKTDMRWISCPGTLPKRGTMSFRVTAERRLENRETAAFDRRGEKIMKQLSVPQ
jgi:hypothetical protein